jgi:hypothetical protein
VATASHLSLVPTLRMSGVLLRLLLCALMAWTGTNIPVCQSNREHWSLNLQQADGKKSLSTLCRRFLNFLSLKVVHR